MSKYREEFEKESNEVVNISYDNHGKPLYGIDKYVEHLEKKLEEAEARLNPKYSDDFMDIVGSIYDAIKPKEKK